MDGRRKMKKPIICFVLLISILFLLPLFHSCVSLPTEGNSGEPCNASETCLPGYACTSSNDCRSSSSVGHIGQICKSGNVCLEGTCVSGICVQGIWTDTTTGYVWMNPSPSYYMTWQSAVDFCNNLTFDGKQWHLPTISELRTLIRNCPETQTGGACGVIDSCLSYSPCWTSACDGCVSKSGCYWDSNLQGTCSWYWSSSSRADNTGDAWGVGFYQVILSYNYKTNYGYGSVRCVRAGP